MQTVIEKRKHMINRLFPQGIPKLWCPLITHFTHDMQIDEERMEAQIRHISPWVNSFLIPGSTGDGWTLPYDQIQRLLEHSINLIGKYKGRILIGILQTESGAARKGIIDTLKWLKELTGFNDDAECLKAANVCGFVICPPKGKDLSQEFIMDELSTVLKLDLPTALYQLPQITENEMSIETIHQLAAKYYNFYLFKDTSGEDRVALSRTDLGGVFLVRGAEGDYHKWLKEAVGEYDGFLLSTANCFAKELDLIIQKVESGSTYSAFELSERLNTVVSQVFSLVTGISVSNPFANANKAIDHVLAYGSKCSSVEPPILYPKGTIPHRIIEEVMHILQANSFEVEKGYLEV